MDWLPPFLIPMSDVAPVTIGPADVPRWLYWLVAGPCAAGWVLTYLFAIRQAILDRRVGIPAFMVAVNFAWEFSLTFLLEQTPTQRGINLTWVIVNVFLLYQVFRYGRADYPSMSPRRFRWTVAGIMAWASLVIMAGANEFRDLDGMYIGIILNVVLSAAFIQMLRRRESSTGQSMYIATAKCVGSLFAGLTGFVVYPSRVLFFVLVPTMVALDVAYMVLLYQRMRAEGRSPWEFRRVLVGSRA